MYDQINPDAQQALSVDENGVMHDYTTDAAQAPTGASSAPADMPVMIPADARRPQDHRKPAKRHITVQGMDLVVDMARIQDDFELIELMAELEGGGEEENLPLVIKLVKAVLGDQYAQVKENCRENGYVSTKKMMAVIQTLFEQVGELGE